MKSKIEFELFAPNNQEAALIGSFSGWKDIPLYKGENGYFRTKIELEDGVYQYKFRIKTKSPNFEANQWIEVIDPYATNIIEGENVGIVRVKNGKKVVDTYVWQHDDKLLPNNHEVIIYEMHIADFTGREVDENKRGTYLDAIKKLDYLSELGINAIELMPVNEYPGDYSWGYKVRHYFAAESSYGSTKDLKRFIDECHARGIRVFLDGIYNHTDEECPLMLIDRNYWYYENKHYPEDPNNYWGPEFNYDNYDEKLDVKPAWKYVGDVVRYWIQEYHVDGIRFDAVRQLANNEFLGWIAHQAKKNTAPKPFYTIAENIPDTSAITTPEGPLDACWHESFRYFVMPHICGEMFDIEKLKEVLDPKLQGYEAATNVINYLATHDRERTLRELGERGIFDKAAFTRAKLGAVLLMTAMGVPMLWMGEEFGERKRKSKSVTEPKKLDWTLLEQDLNLGLFEYYKKLIALRKQNLALQSNNIQFFHEDPTSKVLAYIRWTEKGDRRSRWRANRVIIVANFSSDILKDYQLLNFPAVGTWYDWINSSTVEAGEKGMKINLEGYEAKVLVLQMPN